MDRGLLSDGAPELAGGQRRISQGDWLFISYEPDKRGVPLWAE